MTLTYNGEEFTLLKSRQNPLNVGRYSFLSLVAIQNFELQYSFIPHSAHNNSHNTYTKNEIQLKLNSFSQRAHGLTRRLGYLLRLVSKLPKKVIPKKILIRGKVVDFARKLREPKGIGGILIRVSGCCMIWCCLPFFLLFFFGFYAVKNVASLELV